MMNNKKLLPIGMIFQFMFTVIGGGLLISGLIAGFSLHWDMSGEDNRARIALLLAIFGGILFVIGIMITVILYRISVLPAPSDTGEEGGIDEISDEEICRSKSDREMPDGAETKTQAPDKETGSVGGSVTECINTSEP